MDLCPQSNDTVFNMLSRFYRAQEESLKQELSWKIATLYKALIQTLLETI